MKTRILAVLAASSALVISPAQAGGGHGHGRGDAAAWAIGGLVVGAVAGAVIANASQPQVVYTTPPPAPPAPPAPVAVVPAPAAPAVVYVQAPPPPARVVVVHPAPRFYGPPPVVYACPPPAPVYYAPPCRPVRHLHGRPHFRVGFSVGF